MAKTVASRKQKGMRLQKWVVEAILKAFPALTVNDVRSIPSSVPTEDIWLSAAAKGVFPYSVECKNCEKIAIWQALKQSEQKNRPDTPLLVFKRNQSDIYCCLKFDTFMQLLTEKRPNE